MGILLVPASGATENSTCDTSFQETVSKREHNLNEQIKLNESKVSKLTMQLEEANQGKSEVCDCDALSV